MLEAQYKAPRFDEQLENLQFISQTGMTNTQLWYDSFTSMSDQTRKIQTMTADRDHYNALISAPKSWAQHHAEGQLPFLDKKPRVTKNKKHKPKPPS